MDIISREQRSALMSRIKSKDSGIEWMVRRGLHSLGLRYRLGGAGLPGRPDLVLPRHGAVVFVNGCFWHGHNCVLFRLPKTRPDFWREKIEANRMRDVRSLRSLHKLGWKRFVIWECQLRGRTESQRAKVIASLARRIAPGEQ